MMCNLYLWHGATLSANTCTLLVSCMRTSFGDRAFSAAGPPVCNWVLLDLESGTIYLSAISVSNWDQKRSVNPPLTAL